MPDFAFSSIREIHQAYMEKRLTVRELVLTYLKRIAKFDHCTGGLDSVLELSPDALFIADSLDAQLQNGAGLTPLFGIPILLKDNINTADRLHTSAGSVALQDNYAPYDAHIVKLLREAGAVILGKANMTEFANYMSREGMPSGYSSRGGQVINPYNRLKTPSGSSSGSAVAVAAGLCTVAVGTETAGSIMSPAGHNGIVGIKPTMGLVGRSGIVPISSTHDTAGPMARTVADAAILLTVLAGEDPADPATQAIPASVDHATAIEKQGPALHGVRIGINRTRTYVDPVAPEEERVIFDRLLAALSAAGAELIDHVDVEATPIIRKIMIGEFKACMNYYLSTLGEKSKMKTLRDIIEYNQAHPSIALKYGQSILLDAQNETSGNMTEPEYIEALAERDKAIAALDKLFDDNKIDVMLCEAHTNIAPFTGFPCMTIPIGQKQDNMPMSSYWMARRFDEARLLRIVHAAEQGLGIKLRPELTCDAEKV